MNISKSELASMIALSRNIISSIEINQFNSAKKLALILYDALDKKLNKQFYFLNRNMVLFNLKSNLGGTGIEFKDGIIIHRSVQSY